MCGIVGFMDSKTYRKALPDFWELISHRGDDSFGVIIQDISKKSIRGAKALSIKNIKETTKWEYDKKAKKSTYKKIPPKKGVIPLINKIPVGDFLLAHNRAASIGGKDDINLAHPITKTGVAATVSVIHNGTKRKLFEAMSDIANSDTEAIAQLLSDCFSVNETIKALVEGTGVIFGVNHNTMEVFFHCDGNRPLFINENRDMIASEPIVDGKWYLIKETTTIFKDFIDFLENVEVYEKSVNVDKDDLTFAALCPACNKTHFVDGVDGRCYRCIIKNKEIPKQTYTYNNSYTGTPYNYDRIPKDVLVEYYDSIKGYWGLGKIISYTDDLVKVQDLISGQEVAFNPFTANNYVETDISAYLKIHEKYFFSDNGTSLHFLTFTGESRNKNYPFRVLNQNNGVTVYRFVMYEKNIIDKIDVQATCC